MNKIMKYLECKDDDPTLEKYMKLSDLAEELGISLSFTGGRCEVIDRNRGDDLPPIYLEDLESDPYVNTFPYCFEFRMIYENPVYIEKRNRELAEHKLKMQELQLKKEAEAAEKAAMEEKRRVEEIENTERGILARLLKKYGDV